MDASNVRAPMRRLSNKADGAVSQAEVWAAAGSVDADLSFLRLFELYGATVAERRMQARVAWNWSM